LTRGYDAIFMDVGLPRMSGIEVAAEIRKREGDGRHTPIIALTGFTQDEDLNNCLAAGMDAVATKPIAPEELKRLLLRWLV
jgi:two-component system sensor histidine kinase/response regulator